MVECLCYICPTGPFSWALVGPAVGVIYELLSQFVRNKPDSTTKVLTLDSSSCKARLSEVAPRANLFVGYMIPLADVTVNPENRLILTMVSFRNFRK